MRLDIQQSADNIVGLYLSGNSTIEISKIYSCSKATIIKLLRDNSIRIRKRGEISRNRKYHNIENYFTVPKNENSYWAGFIAADGNIRKNKRAVRVYIQERDAEHIYKLCSVISPFRPINKVRGRNGNANQVGIDVYSRRIVSDLINNFNITENKTLTLYPPSNLLYSNGISYCVGYIDGDGSMGISNNKFYFNVLGTLEVMKYIKEFLLDMNPRLRIKIRKVGNIYGLYGGGNRVKLALQGMIQSIHVPYMERKWRSVVL